MKRLILLASLMFSVLIADDSASGGQTGLRKSNNKNDRALKADKAREVMVIVSKILESNHYDAHVINDDVSKKIFALFIKYLDPAKNILLEEDINTLKQYELKIDDALLSGDLKFGVESLAIKVKRLQEVEAYVLSFLSGEIDILKSEEVKKEDADDISWCKTTGEREKRWAQLIRQFVISNYISLLIDKEVVALAEKKKADGEKTEKVENKEPAAQEEADPLSGEIPGAEKQNIDYAKLKSLPIDEAKLKEAREKVKKNLEVRFRRMREEGEVGNFNNLMNALCGAFDPHTAYHLPEEKESIDINLTGSLQGIGAQLQENVDEVKVMKIIPGSASWKQKQLAVGDVLLKVAQGSQEPVDIRGMNLNDAVRLIRGKKGTEVRLTVKKPDGQIMVIPIIRDVVVLEDSYVHSVIVDDKATGQKIGYVLLPSFYLEQENGKGRSCAADVKKDLVALKAAGVDGIVFDLRGNGGGSLKDVVDMAGFFINSGPIVQVRGPNGYRKILEDSDKNVVFDGPLVVMISNISASASEIFAAAIQDYGRGIVLGSGLSSFGKGTVQTFVPIQEYTAQKEYDVGALRLSIQKYYRINGQTTQFKGVIPDIILPVEYMYMEVGEKFLDNPLPSDLFLPTSYEKWKKANESTSFKLNSDKRIKDNMYFSKVSEYALYLKTRQEEKTIKVSLSDSFKDLEESQKRSVEFRKIKDVKRDIKLSRITVVNNNESSMFKDIESMLPKDPYAFEAFELIKDIKGNIEVSK